MNETPWTCILCGSGRSFQWTDTHGIAVCSKCGLPYRLYHYENDVRVEKPPECTIKSEWVPLAREYWTETRRRVFPAAHDLGFWRGRNGRSYSGATEEDVRLFDEWMDARKDRWPKREEVAAET